MDCMTINTLTLASTGKKKSVNEHFKTDFCVLLLFNHIMIPYQGVAALPK